MDYLDMTVKTTVGGTEVDASSGNAKKETVERYTLLMNQVAAAYNKGAGGSLSELKTAVENLKRLAISDKLSPSMCEDINKLLKGLDETPSTGTIADFRTKFGNQQLEKYKEKFNWSAEFETAKKTTPTLTEEAWLAAKSRALADAFLPATAAAVSERVAGLNAGLSSAIGSAIGSINLIFAGKATELETSLKTASKATDSLKNTLDLLSLKSAPQSSKLDENGRIIDPLTGKALLVDYATRAPVIIDPATKLPKWYEGGTYHIIDPETKQEKAIKPSDTISMGELQKLIKDPGDSKVIVKTAAQQADYAAYIASGMSRRDAIAMVLMKHDYFKSDAIIDWAPLLPEAQPPAKGDYVFTRSERESLYTAVFGQKTIPGVNATFDVTKLTPDQQAKAARWVNENIVSKITPYIFDTGADVSGATVLPIVGEITTEKAKNFFNVIRPNLKAVMDSLPEADLKEPGSLKEKLSKLLDTLPKNSGTGEPSAADINNLRAWIQDEKGDNQRNLTYALTAATAFNDSKKQALTSATTQYQQVIQICMTLIQALQRMVESAFKR